MNETPRSGRLAAAATSRAREGRVGVLLVNLGTPDGTTYWPMRRYLKEFLSDRRVIETNRVLWWLILNGIVLVKRPSASGAKYRAIWNEEKNESPLRTITRSQVEKIARAFAGKKDWLVVDWAMRYGNPSIASRIEALAAEGCDRLLVFPLYPQYSASTTATVNDKAFEALQALRAQPALRTVPPYPDDPIYIGVLADSIKAHLAGLPWEPEAILASFHGVPQAYVDKGDPYQKHCIRTTEALRAKLGPLGGKLSMTFQSRFGRAEWTKPYTDKTIEELARKGTKRLAIVTPGFVADCLETLEEIAEENKELFLENGGEKFSYIPCLNDSEGGIRVLVHLIERELQGWM
jgi:ferrochelatase